MSVPLKNSLVGEQAEVVGEQDINLQHVQPAVQRCTVSVCNRYKLSIDHNRTVLDHIDLADIDKV